MTAPTGRVRHSLTLHPESVVRLRVDEPHTGVELVVDDSGLVKPFYSEVIDERSI
jgi:hypothetical protein